MCRRSLDLRMHQQAESREEENRRVLTCRWIGFTAAVWQRKSPKVTMDPPQSKMPPGSLTEVGREKGMDLSWVLRSTRELAGEVTTEAR